MKMAVIRDYGNEWTALIISDNKKIKTDSSKINFSNLSKMLDHMDIRKEKILVHSKNKPVHLWNY